jgi:predicted transglutaminase-like cysteine proteinase
VYVPLCCAALAGGLVFCGSLSGVLSPDAAIAARGRLAAENVAGSPGRLVLPKPPVAPAPSGTAVSPAPAPSPRGSAAAVSQEAKEAAPEQADLPPSAADGAGPPAGATAESGDGEKWAQPRKEPGRVNLFGTVEFRSRLKDMPQWERVISEERKKPGLDTPKGLAAQWRSLRERLKSRSRMEQLVEVNKFFNRWPYRVDPDVYGVLDYWATPREFMEKSGDCEDYAISKFHALKQLGVAPDEMRIVVVTDTIRNLAHAVLAVYLDGEAYILDNLSNLILPHGRLRHYRPQFSVNEEYRWVHMTPKTK